MSRRAHCIACFLLAALAFAAGCATVTKKPQMLKLVYRSLDEQPSWISIIPEEREYLYFVGTSSDSGSFDEGKKDAVSDALAQVVAAIGISVSSTLTFEERFFSEEYTAIVSRELLSSGRAKLQDSEIVELYHEQWERPDGSNFFRVWVLLKYSRAEIRGEQERIEDILRLKYGEVRRLEYEASESLEKGDILRALVDYINAALLSLKLEDEGVFFNRNMQMAQDIILGIKLSKRGDFQLGWVGEGLSEPLVVTVSMLSDSKELPIPNAPVKFIYRVPKTKSQGYKLRVDRKTTDMEGNASLRLERIYEVSDSNRVEAEIDFGPLLSARLDSVPRQYKDRVRALEELLGTKTVTFSYTSDSHAKEYRTAVFFLQTDENGELIEQTVTAPALYEELLERRFSVYELTLRPGPLVSKSEAELLKALSENVRGTAQRILIGRVQIVEYDEISGFYTARTESVVRLYDTMTGTILGTWQTQKSGTGSSEARARTNALREAGKTLGETLSSSMP
jgi:hypothetical protein